MFKKKEKKFRRRDAADDDEAGEGGGEQLEMLPTATVPAAPKDKGQPPRKLGGTLLSFAADEEDVDTPLGLASKGTSKAKKKAGGYGIGQGGTFHKAEKPTAAPAPKVFNVQASNGEYTKEKLTELARNTKQVGGGSLKAVVSETRGPLTVPRMAGEPVIVLKGLQSLVKVAPAPPPSSLGGRGLEASGGGMGGGEGTRQRTSWQDSLWRR